MYKYYITLNTGESKDVLVVDKTSYNLVLIAMKENQNSFININIDENFKNNQRVISRLINTANIVSLNTVEIKIENEVEDKILIDEFSQYTENYLNQNSYARKFLSKENNYVKFPKKIHVPAWINRHDFYAETISQYASPQCIIEESIDKPFSYVEIGCSPRWKKSDCFDVNRIKEEIARSITMEENTLFLVAIDSKVPKSEEYKTFNHIVQSNVDLAISKVNKGHTDKQVNMLKVNSMIMSSWLCVYVDDIFNGKFIPNKEFNNEKTISVFGWYKEIPIYVSTLMPALILIIPEELGNLIVKDGISCTDKIKGSRHEGLDIVEDIAINITNPKGLAKVIFPEYGYKG